MDWKTIAPIVGAVAPLAGSIIGGLIPFPGGSLIGEKLGKIIAGQLGVAPTPEAVNDKLATASEETKRTAINAAVDRARVEVDGFVAYERAVLEAQVKNLTDVNLTIRAEAEARRSGPPEHWFFRAWRPAFAWGVLSIYVPFGLVLSFTAFRSAYLSPDPLKSLADAWPLLVGFFGVGLAVVGVLIPSRSIEKKAAIEAGAPMPNAKPAAVQTPAANPIAGKPRGPFNIIPPPPGDRS